MQQRLTNKGRHAYLILCHNNFEQLSILLTMLDDERNDIYIHVDKKTKSVPFEMLRSSVKKSGLYFPERVKVTWGGYSQVRSEFVMLEAVAEKGYDYCHFLSGIDLPLKSQDYIHSFFAQLNGKECISFERIENVLDRVKYYYPMQDIVGRKPGKLADLLRKIQDFLLRVQRKLKVNRIRGREEQFHEGANWVSVTGNFAAYIVTKKNFIRRNFRSTYCADELFVQTMVMNSPFKDNIYTDTVRLIDWERGRPYTFTDSDYDELISSGKLFARKFDCRQDADIIQRMYEHVKNS